MFILVLGGSGSGKSAYAENRLLELAGRKTKGEILYIATMEVYGEEGRQKVLRHHELRRRKGMRTIEQKRDLGEILLNASDAVILEDLGNLTANEMFLPESKVPEPEEKVASKILTELEEMNHRVSDLVIVSNVVFEDGISYGDSTMAYIRALGCIHQALAQSADEVVEMVSGIPVLWKSAVKSPEANDETEGRYMQ